MLIAQHGTIIFWGRTVHCNYNCDALVPDVGVAVESSGLTLPDDTDTCSICHIIHVTRASRTRGHQRTRRVDIQADGGLT